MTVSYNSAGDLRRFWSNVEHSGVDWIVVDNHSTDDSVEVAESLGAKIIRLDNNLGFGAACNVGLREARGDVVGFVNPDVEVSVADIAVLREHALSEPRFIAPQLLNTDGSLQPNGRGSPSLLNKVFNRLLPWLARRRGFQIYAHAGEIKNVDWVTGAAIFARRTLVESLGGFDEDFFVYYEDVDLCLRAGRAGIPSTIVGDVRWVHGWARDSAGWSLSGWKLELSGAITFYRKYPRLLFALRSGALG